MSFPKTIVLTTLPNKLPLIKTATNDLLKTDRCSVSILLDSQMKRKDSYSSESDISPAPIRKRQRLDHLSSEEKMLRRKLKNRVAAQCARDRKKAKMMSLEDQVIELEREKKVLMKENFILKQHNQQLERENKELKQRLCLQETTENSTSVKNTALPIKKEDSCESFEYAEGAGSATSYCLDDAIRMLADDCETDDILNILQKCSEELLQDNITSSSITEETDQRTNTERKSNDQMVGPTSAELESIKELVEFDHIYYKQDSIEVPVSNQQVISTESISEESLYLPEVNQCKSFELAPEEKELAKQDIRDDEMDLSPISPDLLIPTISIKEEYDTIPNPISPLNSVQIICDRSPSPSVCDSGYDSVNSPFSENGNFLDNTWNDSFTELFPSLI